MSKKFSIQALLKQEKEQELEQPPQTQLTTTTFTQDIDDGIDYNLYKKTKYSVGFNGVLLQPAQQFPRAIPFRQPLTGQVTTSKTILVQNTYFFCVGMQLAQLGTLGIRLRLNDQQTIMPYATQFITPLLEDQYTLLHDGHMFEFKVNIEIRSSDTWTLDVFKGNALTVGIMFKMEYLVAKN